MELGYSLPELCDPAQLTLQGAHSKSLGAVNEVDGPTQVVCMDGNHRSSVFLVTSSAIINEDKLFRINISGVRYSVLRSTLESDTYIYQKLLDEAAWLEESEELFVERDPSLFPFVLSYLKHKELHLPQNLCGPYLQKEMDAWGVPLGLDIQRCCFGSVMETKSRLKSLKHFEKAFKETPVMPDMIVKSKRWQTFRNKAWTFLNYSRTLPSSLYSILQALTVFCSIFIFVAGSHPMLHPKATTDKYLAYNSVEHNSNNISVEFIDKPKSWLFYADFYSMTVLTVDLLLRTIFCPSLPKFFLNIYTIIDSISLIPFYFEKVHLFYLDNETDLISVVDYVNFMKIFVIFRVFRLLRRNKAFRVLLYTIRTTINEIAILLTFISMECLFFGTLIYFVDQENFANIPAGLWWSLITMSTVGYGDMVPSTIYGYIVGGTCAICGVVLMAFMVPILVNSFMMYYSHSDVLVQLERFHKKAQKRFDKRKMFHVARQAIKKTKELMSSHSTLRS